jgi:hypothetical protein
MLHLSTGEQFLALLRKILPPFQGPAVQGKSKTICLGLLQTEDAGSIYHVLPIDML